MSTPNRDRALARISGSRNAVQEASGDDDQAAIFLPPVGSAAVGAGQSSPAEAIAATVGAAVDRSVAQLVPYGSRADTFKAECAIRHRSPNGSVTEATLRFEFRGGSGR